MSAMGDYALWLEETGCTDSEASREAYLAAEADRLAEMFDQAAEDYGRFIEH